jgi:hypothetical protein
MASDSDKPSSGSPEVQTFGMPKPPPPPPEEPEEQRKEKASASHWVILTFLMALGGLIGFYTLYWGPKVEAERAEAEAAANYVRPWPERVEESIRSTFEGKAGDDFATSIMELLDPEGSDAKLQKIDLMPSEDRMVATFRFSWNQAVPEGEEGGQLTLSTASVKWTCTEKQHVSAELLVPEGGAAPNEEQSQGIGKIFSTLVRPLVKRNTAER